MLTQQEIRQQLDLTNQVINDIKNYQGKTIADLPQELKNKIKRLPIGKFITSSGIEKVNSILTRLIVSQYYLDEAYKDPDGFKERYSQKQKTDNQNINKPMTNNKPPIPPTSAKIDISNNYKKSPSSSPNEKTGSIKINIKTDKKETVTSSEKNEQINSQNKSYSTDSQIPSNPPPPSSNIKI